MTLNVAAYLMGIPPGNTNPEKPQIIVNFIEGVWAAGDKGTIVCDYNPIDTDVGVIQGFVHDNKKNAPHLKLRQDVYNTQTRRGKRTIIVDSNLFLYADPGNSQKFLRYSYDGIFPSTGEYCNSNPDPARWELIKKRLGIDLKPWKKDGRYILICCQRDGGWSMNNQPLMPWLIKTIKDIQKCTQKPIMVRFHPGDKNVLNHKRDLVRYRLQNVIISHSANIMDDFKTASAVVNHNSSPGVVAAIEGIPVFLTDSNNSQAKDVAHSIFSYIENPRDFDRESWIHRMAQMHWTLDELKDGSAWRHLRKWAIK
jgi:hypothetical protein